MTDSVLPSRTALPWLWLSALAIGLDQWTKHFALANLVKGHEVPWIPGFWSWQLTFNRGASFSMGAQAGPWMPFVFIALAFVISALLIHWLRRTPRGDWRTALPFALIIGGALGNVIDRFRFGEVVDFILWRYESFSWPVFNVADSCIVLGAALMLLLSFRRRPAGG